MRTYRWPSPDAYGKTKAMETVTLLSFLGRTMLSGSSYPALRDAASWGATVGLDDFESIENPQLREMILAGNRRGATVSYKEKRKDGNWDSVSVDTFSARMFSAINQPDPVWGSRSIGIPMVRSGNSAKTHLEPREDSQWPCERRSLIDKLWLIALHNLVQIRSYYDAVTDLTSLRGRDLDPWRGILTVARWLDIEHNTQALFQRLNDVAVRYQRERATLESGRDATRLVITALLDLSAPQSGSELRFDAASIAKRVNELAIDRGIVEAGETFTTPKKVGWVCRSLRLLRGSKGKNDWPWIVRRDDLEKLVAAYNIEPTIAENAENADNAA